MNVGVDDGSTVSGRRGEEGEVIDGLHQDHAVLT